VLPQIALYELPFLNFGEHLPPELDTFSVNPRLRVEPVCNLHSITTNQAAIIALFRVINRCVGNLPPLPGVFPNYPTPVVRNAGAERELTMMRWGISTAYALRAHSARSCQEVAHCTVMPISTARRANTPDIERLSYRAMGGCSGRLYLSQDRQNIGREGVRSLPVCGHAFCLRIPQISAVSQNCTLCLLLSQSGAGYSVRSMYSGGFPVSSTASGAGAGGAGSASGAGAGGAGSREAGTW
jgi:hypothetical protein